MTREPVTDDELARARALIESSELAALSRMDEVADRLSMYATYFDRPELINEQLGRYLAVDAEAVRAVCAEVFGTRQPGRPDVRAARPTSGPPRHERPGRCSTGARSPGRRARTTSPTSSGPACRTG